MPTFRLNQINKRVLGDPVPKAPKTESSSRFKIALVERSGLADIAMEDNINK
jgi:hypothetical protein